MLSQPQDLTRRVCECADAPGVISSLLYLFCSFSSDAPASDSGCSPCSSTRSKQRRKVETASGRLCDLSTQSEVPNAFQVSFVSFFRSAASTVLDVRVKGFCLQTVPTGDWVGSLQVHTSACLSSDGREVHQIISD